MEHVKNKMKKHCPKIYEYVKKIYHKYKPKEVNICHQQRGSIQMPSLPAWNRKNTIVEGLVYGSDRKNKLLIIGRLREGDSIATNTTAFLQSVDFEAIDVFLYEEYTHNLYLYKRVNHAEYVKTCFANELDPSFFDIMIYANVLDNCEPTYPFSSRVPTKSPFLSFAYPVFDGTIPPKEWVNALNMYFDGVITPCQNLKSIFEKANVVKPIFELPIAQNLKQYTLRSQPHKRDEYVFGWIGTFEDRKNPLKIIEAFEKAFGETEKVKLLMHTRFIDRNTESGKQFNVRKEQLPSNIRITEGVLPEQEIVELMNSFDTYVYPSMGEGYSITPRQALSTGLSVILSDIPTHRDITSLNEINGVIWVPAQTEIDAVQPSLNNYVCGKMYDIKMEKLVEAFRYIYENRDFVNSCRNIEIRQKEMEKYDISNIKYLVKQLILPTDVRMASDNRISEDGIDTMDRDLFVKYQYLIKNERRNIVVCPAHDGGFCSVFNKWMSHLVYSSDNTILIPDWRIKSLKGYVLNTFAKKEFTSFCYGTEADGNLFFRLFENPYKGLINEEILETSLMYQVADCVLATNDFNEAKEPNLTYLNSYNLYEDEVYFQKFREKYNHYYKKYIKFVPELQKRIDDFAEANLKDKFVITAHIRSAAHQSELREGDKPTWDLYEKKVRSILDQEGIENDQDCWRLFIASDNDQSIEHFKEIWGEHVISQNMKRLSAEDDKEYQAAARKAGKNIEGFGLQHRAAADESKWSLENAYEILFDVSILAMGKYYIFVNSNISTMVSYVNPKVKMVYCR